jgi:hypothetical protein
MKSAASPIAVAPHQPVGKPKVLRSFFIFLLVLALVAGVVLIRRAVRLSGAADPRLVGKWTSDYFPTEWGTARIILQFDRETLEVEFDPIDGGRMSGTGTYSVSNGTIQSPALDSGKQLRYTIDGDVLTFLDPVDGPSVFARPWWSDIWP